MALVLSRGSTIDTEKCVEKIGNRFDLVIAASARAKELKRQHSKGDRKKYLNAHMQALIDIQEGKAGREYLKKIK